jgi:hypothetical protein
MARAFQPVIAFPLWFIVLLFPVWLVWVMIVLIIWFVAGFVKAIRWLFSFRVGWK